MSEAYKIKNLERILKKIESDKGAVQQLVKMTLADTAQTIALAAKDEAPKDFGKLKQSITAKQGGDYLWYINVNLGLAPYAAYVEFGTGGFAASYVPTLPESWQTLAWEFKGENDPFKPMEQRPFLYPALMFGRQYLRDELLANYDKLMK